MQKTWDFDKITLGVIGCGGMAGTHVRALGKLKQMGLVPFEVAAVCDLDAARVETYADLAAQELGARPRTFTDWREMLKAVDLEAAAVFVHHKGHHEISIPLMQMGVHVIVEKPMALVPSLGLRMAEAAHEFEVKLVVAENYRFTPWNEAVARAVAQGLIGEPYFIVKQFSGVGGDVFCGTPWRHSLAQGGAGPIFDNGVHDADLMMLWLGDIDEVYSVNRICEKVRTRDGLSCEPTCEDLDASVLRFKNGAVGQWLCSWAGHGIHFNFTLINGSLGAIDVNDRKVKLDNGTEMGEDELVARYAPELWPDSIMTELFEFGRCIRTDGEPVPGPEVGYKSMCVSFAALESALRREPVKVEDILSGKLHAYEDKVLAAARAEDESPRNL